ncbi:hypothetical protein [Olivibacter sitiensis]|uniref:hypothetical protein n=1 Tax=Olivibacter sitiensis TaxID=376470 RepID=UPI000416B177|nr:hypothetical protein [Olivibacter sitiensis]
MENITFQDLDGDIKLLVYFMAILIMAVYVAYVVSVRSTIKLIAPENRFIQPNHAFLLLLPIFNVYWQFVVANRLSDSLTNEFYDRKIAEEENPGRSTGRVFAVLSLLVSLPIPSVSMVFALAYMTYFVLYWTKVIHFKHVLAEHDRYLESKGKGKPSGEM